MQIRRLYNLSLGRSNPQKLQKSLQHFLFFPFLTGRKVHGAAVGYSDDEVCFGNEAYTSFREDTNKCGGAMRNELF